RHARRTHLERVLLSHLERALPEPEEAHAQSCGDLRHRIGLAHRELAARDVDLFRERHARRPTSGRLRLRLPDGRNTSRSPTETCPASMVPATMRRSSPCPVNLYTSWTRSRNGSPTGGASGSKVSSACSTVGPSYHGMRVDLSARLSPSRPLTGMNRAGVMFTCARNAESEVTNRSYSACENP